MVEMIRPTFIRIDESIIFSPPRMLSPSTIADREISGGVNDHFEELNSPMTNKIVDCQKKPLKKPSRAKILYFRKSKWESIKRRTTNGQLRVIYKRKTFEHKVRRRNKSRERRQARGTRREAPGLRGFRRPPIETKPISFRGSPYKCNSCHGKFYLNRVLNMYSRRRYGKKYRCPLCDYNESIEISQNILASEINIRRMIRNV